ncbi:MAG TPA: hypothetical protein VGF67_18110 [Ktedonobacteraceae bacterium]|jgi:ribulose bisphosphate carboxylase small subunit
MEQSYQRCCGLDVQKKVVVAGLIVIQANGQKQKEMHTFRTVTAE